MNLTSLMTRECIVENEAQPLVDDDDQPVTDDYGAPIMGEPTEFHLDPAQGPAAYLEQVSTTEVTDGQQTAPGTWWAALPAGTPVFPTSRLRFPDSGQTFHVEGEIATRWQPWRRRIEFIRVELGSET